MTHHQRRNEYPLYIAPEGTQQWSELVHAYSRQEAESFAVANASTGDIYKITRRQLRTGEETVLETGGQAKTPYTQEEARDHVLSRIAAADEHGHPWDIPAILRELHTLAGSSWDLGKVSEDDLWTVIYQNGGNDRDRAEGESAL